MEEDNSKILILVLLLAGLILVAPYFIRIWQGNPYTVNSDSYYNLRLYNDIDSRFYDKLQLRNTPINLMYLIPLKENYGFLMTKILTFFLGLGSIILAYMIMKKNNISSKISNATLLLLIASPLFIGQFIDFTFYAITIFLGLLSIYLLSENRNTPATIINLILPFIDIYSAVMIFLLQAVYILAKYNTWKKHKIFMITTLTAILASIALNYYLGYKVFEYIPILKSNIISDIGANTGFSFSGLLLSLIGLVLLWEKGWKNLIIYSMMIVLIVVSIFSEVIRVYLNFILIVYAGFAFSYLTRRKWSISIIKKITLLLIICSILFTTLVYMTKVISNEPTPGYIEAFSIIEKISNQNDTIFSSQENGYMLQYYAKRKTFIDEKSIFYNKKITALFDNISSSRNLERTEGMLNNNSIKVIFADKGFTGYLEEKEGMLFLINTSGKFKEVYKKDDIGIWMYIG